MYRFKVLVQNKRARNGVYHFRNGYIKASSEEEAIKNINTVFAGFNFAIDYIKPALYVAA